MQLEVNLPFYLCNSWLGSTVHDLFVITTLFFQVRTFRGHKNEKNFVGLSVNNEYIACGSETNEVFVYHKVIAVSSCSCCHTACIIIVFDAP